MISIPRFMEKFTFDRDFLSENPEIARENVARRETRSAKVREAEAQGYAAGQADAVAEAERRAAAALEEIAAAAHQLFSTVAHELERICDDSSRLGVHIARRFVGRLLEDLPEDYIARTIDSCLDIARREAHLRIELPEDLSEKLSPKIAETVAAKGLAERVSISSAPGLSGIACSLDWQTGGAAIDLRETLSAIDKAVEDHIAAIQLARSCEAAEDTRNIA